MRPSTALANSRQAGCTRLALLIGLALSAPASLRADILMLDFGPTAATGSALTNSPEHATGVLTTEDQWNQIQTNDLPSGLVAADGTARPGISVDLGSETGGDTKVIDFGVNPGSSSALGSTVNAGVYAGASVGTDGIFHTVGDESRGIGLRIDGLAAGEYDVFVTGRNTSASGSFGMNFHAAAAPSAASFDFNAVPASTADNVATVSWAEGNNYCRITLAVGSGDSLFIAADGRETGKPGRGFFNSVQILPATEPPPPPPPIHVSDGYPNILILFADDLGFETIGAYGGLDFTTPNIDRMATQGARFARAYTSPVCTPSRVSLHTSLYTTEHGHTTVLPVHTGTTASVDFGSMPTFAQLLQAKGYETSVTGKWQLAALTYHPDHPFQAGFDSWCLWQIWDGAQKTTRYWNPYFNRDGGVFPGISDRFGPDVLEEYVWERMTTARDSDTPFLIVHNMLLPHEPITETPMDRELDRAASLGNMIEYLDRLVGRMLNKVEQLGIRDQTYVFFIGDNGTEADHAAVRHTTAGDVTGGKRDLNEGGTHVPMIVWGPRGVPAGSVVNDLIDITDVFPSVCHLAKTDIPETIPYNGTSFVPQMHGRRGVARTWVHQGIGSATSVFDGDWRLRSNGTLVDCSALPAEQAPTPGEAADTARTRLEPLLDGIPDTEAPGTIIDNSDSTGVIINGSWTSSSATAGFYGTDYLHDGNALQAVSSISTDLATWNAADTAFTLRETAALDRSFTETCHTCPSLKGTWITAQRLQPWDQDVQLRNAP